MRLRELAIGSVVVAVAATGCATSGSHATLRVERAGNGQAASAVKGKSAVPASPDLELTVSPTSGAPGTVVHVEATGCADPTGLNHAVSFNLDNRSAGHAAGAVRTIPATLSGTSLKASYRIPAAAHAASHGVFYAQCGSSVVSTPFTVTR